MTASCYPTFHVQSMIWATDLAGLTVLLFPPTAALQHLATHPVRLGPYGHQDGSAAALPGINACFNWTEAVAAEISAAALMRAAGYKIDVMMSAYHKSGRAVYEEECVRQKISDVLRVGNYFGTNLHPYDTLFLKTNRVTDPLNLQRLTEWMKGRAYKSYDYCKA
jgi:hypothetical protein